MRIYVCSHGGERRARARPPPFRPIRARLATLALLLCLLPRPGPYVGLPLALVAIVRIARARQE